MIKQFGFHGRQGGGVCGIEMALFDLAGKAYGVPAYQLVGGKFRDQVLIYCDTDSVPDGAVDGAAAEGSAWMTASNFSRWTSASVCLRA